MHHSVKTSVSYKLYKVLIKSIPMEVERIVVYTTTSRVPLKQREQYGNGIFVHPEVIRAEGRTTIIDGPEIDRLFRSVKKYPIENISFSGFVLTGTHLGAEDEVIIRAKAQIEAAGMHDYSNREAQTVYEFSRER